MSALNLLDFDLKIVCVYS